MKSDYSGYGIRQFSQENWRFSVLKTPRAGRPG